MGYKFRPSAAAKAAYRETMELREALKIVTANGAIRTGCFVEWLNVGRGVVMSGTVLRHSYGADKGQHTFTINVDGGLVLVKGRNLYPNLIKHTPGAESCGTS